MPLQVVTQPDGIGPHTFLFQVPGHQRWKLRTVRTEVFRDVGGAPNRAYSLTITDGTTDVAQSGAADVGSEPGTCSVTWCDAPASAVAAGGIGFVVAPLSLLVLEPGYQIIGLIVNPAGFDAFETPVVWVDYTLTG